MKGNTKENIQKKSFKKIFLIDVNANISLIHQG